MPRVHHVKKARKNYKEDEIKKGESYYWWKFRYGGLHRSKTPPKPSQLTQSEFLSTMYSIEETIQELSIVDDLESSIEEIKGELENLRDETQDKFDNMPEGLQQGDTGQLLEGRVSSVEDMISELEQIDTEVSVTVDEDSEEGETEQETQDRIAEAREKAEEERKQEILDEIQGISYQGE